MSDNRTINQVTLHYSRPHINSMPKIVTIGDAITCFRENIDQKQLDLKHYCWVMLLNRQGNVLGISQVSSGTIKGAHTNIREIMQLALVTNASEIIVVRNHPDGNLIIAEDEMVDAKKLQQASELFGIHFGDYLIVTSESFKSIMWEMED